MGVYRAHTDAQDYVAVHRWSNQVDPATPCPPLPRAEPLGTCNRAWGRVEYDRECIYVKARDLSPEDPPDAGSGLSCSIRSEPVAGAAAMNPQPSSDIGG